ncbi:hypothetical protein HGB24_00590 [Candidatus Saccharibacteria bacterium]|nr:hypothetical protein [Candidatus Saccharibacteria bacterium]
MVLAASIVLCVGMGIVQNSTNPKNTPAETYGGPYSHALVDTFHEGETLGPIISYRRPELAPYRDFVIVHGVFQDVLRTDIAFRLFGESIGSSRAFSTILTILGMISFFVLVLVLFQWNIFKSAITISFLSLFMIPNTAFPIISNDIFGVLLPFRDIATIIFLIVATIGLRAVKRNTEKTLVFASAVIGFIAVAGFANSIDRALYIAVLSIFWIILLYIINPAKSIIKNTLLPYAIGLLIGFPVLGIAIKWAYADFFSYLLTMSKYKEYLDGVILSRPNMAVSIILLSTSVILTYFGYRLINIFEKTKKKVASTGSKYSNLISKLSPLVSKNAIPIMLFATGLVFLRSAIGRALPDHWIYSVQWIYLFVAYVGVNYIFNAFKKKENILKFISLMILVSCLLVYGLLVKRIDIHNDTFPVGVPDTSLMRTDYIQTADFLKNNLKENETFVTLTSEASWYYFVGKPSPIKYPVIWYAFTKEERLKIADSINTNSNIKYIITNNNWTSNFDYVPNETRFPEVYSVLYDKYIQFTGFGQQTIWIRK